MSVDRRNLFPPRNRFLGVEAILGRLQAGASTAAEIEQRLLAFFGVGPVTANIFLRELRPHWPLVDPEPLPAIVETARRLGIDLDRYDRKSLAFVRLEAGLTRLRHIAAQGRPP